ncbi:hypothetical protein [Hymenobacter sp. DG25A]|uniref:hypothetical protein n=1 Tax=Hymenobacter sp. DG25A TaxID=1385663 RepID=UPI0006BC76DC|nr:hypothetical protein [Hymenobacter sp. DG25A]ALD22007.1 hypothetical protein AM218_13290 [Hymenobacter sp. DG25A]
MAFEILFRVARSIHVPGLGLLVLPAKPSAVLQQLPLHSALEVFIGDAPEDQLPIAATVEEVQFAGDQAESAPAMVVGLLLESSTTTALLPGTALWWQPTS